MDDGAQTQPVSPQNEGIDPLTEGNTLYPVQNTKDESEQDDRPTSEPADEPSERGATSTKPATK